MRNLRDDNISLKTAFSFKIAIKSINDEIVRITFDKIK